MRGKTGTWGWLLGGSLLLAACRGPMVATPTATPTAAVLPTSSPIATEAPAERATPTAASPSATETVSARATPTAEASPVSAPYVPPSIERCESIRALVSEIVGVEATVALGPFEDYVQGLLGEGCTVEASVPPDSFTHFVDVALALAPAMEAEGLTEDFMYAADGPQGTGTAFREPTEGLLCLLQVSQEAVGEPYAVRLQCAVASPPS